MFSRVKRFVVRGLAFALLAAACPAEQVPVWTTGTGTTTIVLQRGLLSALGFVVGSESGGGFPIRFSLTAESSIKFVSPWGSPDSFLGGSLKCDRGFTLAFRHGGETNIVAIAPLELFALKDTDVFELRDEESEPVFTIDHFDVRFDPGEHSILLRRGNLHFTKQFAARIGRDELAGLVVGVVESMMEVHELAARIERRPRPLPSSCGLPAGTNTVPIIRDIGSIQALDEPECGLCPVAISVALENPGPYAMNLSELENTRMLLSLLVVRAGTTSELVRIERPVRVDAAERCPCPDVTKLYPGFVTQFSFADAIAARTWLPVATDALESAARGESSMIFEVRISEDPVRRAMKPKRCGPVWLFESVTSP